MDNAPPPADEPKPFSYTLKRDAEGLFGRWRDQWLGWWQSKRFRLATYAVLVIFALILLAWTVFARNLPDAEALIEYESPLPTVVRDVNGEPFHSYARERRVQSDIGLLSSAGVAIVLSPNN